MKHLQWWAKGLCILVPGIFQIIYTASMKMEGADKKIAELKRWTFYGYGLYLGLFLLIFIISKLIQS